MRGKDDDVLRRSLGVEGAEKEEREQYIVELFSKL